MASEETDPATTPAVAAAMEEKAEPNHAPPAIAPALVKRSNKYKNACIRVDANLFQAEIPDLIESAPGRKGTSVKEPALRRPKESGRDVRPGQLSANDNCVWSPSTTQPAEVDRFLLYERNLVEQSSGETQNPYGAAHFRWDVGPNSSLIPMEADEAALHFLHLHGGDVARAQFHMAAQVCAGTGTRSLEVVKVARSASQPLTSWQASYTKTMSPVGAMECRDPSMARNYTYPVDLVRRNTDVGDEEEGEEDDDEEYDEDAVRSPATVQQDLDRTRRGADRAELKNNWTTLLNRMEEILIKSRKREKPALGECLDLLVEAASLPPPEQSPGEGIIETAQKTVAAITEMTFKAREWVATVSDTLGPGVERRGEERNTPPGGCAEAGEGERVTLPDLEKLLSESHSLPVQVKEAQHLVAIIAAARDWQRKADELIALLKPPQRSDSRRDVQLGKVTQLLAEAAAIPVYLEQFAWLRERLACANAVAAQIREAFPLGRRTRAKTSLSEAQALLDKVHHVGLACPESTALVKHLASTREWLERAAQALETTVGMRDLQVLLTEAGNLSIDPGKPLEDLQAKLHKAADWLERVRKAVPKQRSTRRTSTESDTNEKVDVSQVKGLLDQSGSMGVAMDLKEFDHMNGLIDTAEEWMTRVREVLESGETETLDSLGMLLEEAEGIPVTMDEQQLLTVGIKARQWRIRVDKTLADPLARVETLAALTEEGDALKASFPDSTKGHKVYAVLDASVLKELLGKGRAWITSAKKCTSSMQAGKAVAREALVDLLERARSMPLDLSPQVDVLDSALKEVDLWVASNQGILAKLGLISIPSPPSPSAPSDMDVDDDHGVRKDATAGTGSGAWTGGETGPGAESVAESVAASESAPPLDPNPSSDAAKPSTKATGGGGAGGKEGGGGEDAQATGGDGMDVADGDSVAEKPQASPAVAAREPAAAAAGPAEDNQKGANSGEEGAGDTSEQGGVGEEGGAGNTSEQGEANGSRDGGSDEGSGGEGSGDGNGKVSLSTLSACLYAAERMSAGRSAKEIRDMRSLMNRVNDWVELCQQLCPRRHSKRRVQPSTKPTFGRLAELIAVGEAFPVDVSDEIVRVREHIRAVASWQVEARAALEKLSGEMGEQAQRRMEMWQEREGQECNHRQRKKAGGQREEPPTSGDSASAKASAGASSQQGDEPATDVAADVVEQGKPLAQEQHDVENAITPASGDNQVGEEAGAASAKTKVEEGAELNGNGHASEAEGGGAAKGLGREKASADEEEVEVGKRRAAKEEEEEDSEEERENELERAEEATLQRLTQQLETAREMNIFMLEEILAERMLDIVEWTRSVRDFVSSADHGLHLDKAKDIVETGQAVCDLSTITAGDGHEPVTLSEAVSTGLDTVVECYQRKVQAIQARLERADDWEVRAKSLLAQDRLTTTDLEDMLKEAQQTGTDQGDLGKKIKAELARCRSWLTKARQALNGKDKLPVPALKRLVTEGDKIKAAGATLRELRRHLKLANKWSQAVRKSGMDKGLATFGQIKALIAEAASIRADLSKEVEVLKIYSFSYCICHRLVEDAGALITCTTCGEGYHTGCMGIPKPEGSKNGSKNKENYSCIRCQIMALFQDAEGSMLQAMRRWLPLTNFAAQAGIAKANPSGEQALDRYAASQNFAALATVVKDAMGLPTRCLLSNLNVLNEVDNNLAALANLNWGDDVIGKNQYTEAKVMLSSLRVLLWCAMAYWAVRSPPSVSMLSGLVAQGKMLSGVQAPLLDPLLDILGSICTRADAWLAGVRELFKASPDLPDDAIDTAKLEQLQAEVKTIPVRILSESKVTAALEDQGGRYCYCRGPNDGSFMVGCDVCEEWFHGSCVNLKDQGEEKMSKDYICPSCSRSRGVPYSYGEVDQAKLESEGYVLLDTDIEGVGQLPDDHPEEAGEQEHIKWPPKDVKSFFDSLDLSQDGDQSFSRGASAVAEAPVRVQQKKQKPQQLKSRPRQQQQQQQQLPPPPLQQQPPQQQQQQQQPVPPHVPPQDWREWQEWQERSASPRAHHSSSSNQDRAMDGIAGGRGGDGGPAHPMAMGGPSGPQGRTWSGVDVVPHPPHPHYKYPPPQYLPPARSAGSPMAVGGYGGGGGMMYHYSALPEHLPRSARQYGSPPQFHHAIQAAAGVAPPVGEGLMGQQPSLPPNSPPAGAQERSPLSKRPLPGDQDVQEGEGVSKRLRMGEDAAPLANGPDRMGK